MPSLDAINFYGAALLASGRASKVAASNIANADTPGYKARGLDFQEALQARLQGAVAGLKYERGLPMGLDDNNVSIEYESLQSARYAQRTRESMTFLEHSTQRLITALRPQSNGGQ